MGFQSQLAGRVGEHRLGVGLGKAFAGQHLQEDQGVTAGHVGVGLAFGGLVAEVAPAINDLFGRAAADAQLQAAAGDQVGGTGVLHHVQRVLVAHVDDGGADLDAAGARADGGQQREGRAQLAGEVMDAKVGTIDADPLGLDRQFDGLQQRVGRSAGLRAAGG